MTKYYGIQVLENPQNIKMLLNTNNLLTSYCLCITEEMAVAILSERKNILEKYGRVEIDCSILEKIIEGFMDSPYIQQEDYESIIEGLHEIFHYMKSELEDAISDDELIEFMVSAYNGVCDGSLELLAEREAYGFISKIRQGVWYDE